MEVFRYVLVFFVVGWGGGAIAGVLSLVGLPVLSSLRQTATGRLLAASINGVATALSVYVAHLVCQWTGGEVAYVMFLPPLVALLLNDRSRIRRAQTARTIAGQQLDGDPEIRAGVVQTERMNLVADLVGLAVGVALLPATELL